MSARVHPGETPSSFVMQGIIRCGPLVWAPSGMKELVSNCTSDSAAKSSGSGGADGKPTRGCSRNAANMHEIPGWSIRSCFAQEHGGAPAAVALPATTSMPPSSGADPAPCVGFYWTTRTLVLLNYAADSSSRCERLRVTPVVVVSFMSAHPTVCCGLVGRPITRLSRLGDGLRALRGLLE